MTSIALIGAGGKMGVRLSTNLKGSRFDVSHVEISEAGTARLKDELDVDTVPLDEAVNHADVVVLAVPDRMIGRVSHEIIGKVRSGCILMVLDAAAPFAGEMPPRDDVTYFCTHPCHPPLFGMETDPAAQKDFFGGVAAKQGIVCALIQGPEEHYKLGEDVAKTIYAPVVRSHRCTLEHIAILEPALSETVGATLCLALREATDEAIRRGVPKDAAMDFMRGHLNIELSIAFGVFPEGRFSDGALKAIDEARPVIFREGWLDRVFSPASVRESVMSICKPDEAA